MGHQLLSRAYNFRQQESEEVSLGCRLDNQIRQAKNHGELLPDKEAVDRHLRLLFCQGLEESIKDKARQKGFLQNFCGALQQKGNKLGQISLTSGSPKYGMRD